MNKAYEFLFEAIFMCNFGGREANYTAVPCSLKNFSVGASPIRVNDFVDGTAIIPLKFRSVSPEFDFKLWPEAILNLRLGVPGEGNFATSAPVMLRQLSPFRDRLQIYEGSRFFPMNF